MPSLEEGFGLPVLEAMACGTPAITSNISSMPEIASDGACLVSPYSPMQIMEAVLKILNSNLLRSDISERGTNRTKELNWASAADKLITHFQTIKEQ